MRKNLQKMIEFTCETRVRYGETDQMGFVYYGNYALYFELGRVETLRHAGITYHDIEKRGIGMPVRHMEVHYKSAATYDELIKICTKVSALPESRFHFEHHILGQDDRLICTGSVTLYFIRLEDKKVIRCPDWLLSSLKPIFNP